MIDMKNLSSVFVILTMRKLIVYDKISKEFTSKGLHKEDELFAAISKLGHSYFLSKIEEETGRLSNLTNMKEILDDKGTLNLIRKQIF
jgi:hypothetical protein